MTLPALRALLERKKTEWQASSSQSKNHSTWLIDEVLAIMDELESTTQTTAHKSTTQKPHHTRDRPRPS